MKIGLVVIGDELLKGETQDRNLFWIGKYLRSIGHRLSETVIIPDTLKEISTTLSKFHESYDLTIVSGGLGPTKDDRTKQALSLFSGELKESSEAAELVKKHYDRRGLTWHPERNHYHFIPENISPVHNPVGLAPGLYSHQNGRHLLCAPGVPREFEKMIPEFMEERLSHLLARKTDYVYIKTAGVPEERIFGEISPTLWSELEQFGEVSSYPRWTGIDILVDGLDPSRLNELTSIEALERLSPYTWHIGKLDLHEMLVKKLMELNQTVATAESCTGGLLASFLTDVSGSSNVFMGSVVSYSNDIKMDELGVSPELIENHGAVSAEVAEAMAIGAKKKFDVDYAMSTSGIAGPNGGTKDKPVGTVAIGLATPEGSTSKIYHLPDLGRLENKKRFAVRAMFSLVKAINKIS